MKKWNLKIGRLLLLLPVIPYFLFAAYLHCQDVEYLLAEGKKFIKEKKYDEASKVLMQAKSADEKSPRPDLLLGIMFLKKDSLWEAETHLKAAEKLNPDLAPAQYMLALLYEKKAENEKAILYWNKLSKNPNFKDMAKKHLQFLGGEK